MPCVRECVCVTNEPVSCLFFVFLFALLWLFVERIFQKPWKIAFFIPLYVFIAAGVLFSGHPFVMNMISQECLEEEFLQTWLNHPLHSRMKRPIGGWWSKILVTSLNTFFFHNSRIYKPIVTKLYTNIQLDNMVRWWHFISKRSKIDFNVTS